MPMTDDGPCFFCGTILTYIDGICICDNKGGCGAYERYKRDKDGMFMEEIEWVVPQDVVLKLAKEGRLYK